MENNGYDFKELLNVSIVAPEYVSMYLLDTFSIILDNLSLNPFL
jgi:hypothetical protein